MEMKEYYNLDCEQVVIGTILASNAYFKRVRSVLKSDYFYSDDKKRFSKNYKKEF